MLLVNRDLGRGDRVSDQPARRATMSVSVMSSLLVRPFPKHCTEYMRAQTDSWWERLVPIRKVKSQELVTLRR